METATAGFRIDAIPAHVLDEVRGTGLDASGNRVQYLTASRDGGEPLRCCLRNATPGERLLLFGYAPPMPASPYREVGAVLTHADPCTGPLSRHAYPPGWYGRPQVLRAYDRRGWIHDETRTHDGTTPEAIISAMLANPEVVEIHSRNIAWGCYMMRITRPAVS